MTNPGCLSGVGRLIMRTREERLYLKERRRSLLKPYWKSIRFALFLLFLSISVGVVGYITLEGYTLLESLYMTVITLGTVGYSEVRPLSDAGRIFTTFLILFNLSVFAYSLSFLTGIVGDKELRNRIRYLRLLKTIEHLKQHIIVCGYGRHGSQVVSELRKAHIPLVVIEPDQEKIQQLEELGIPYLAGEAAQEQLLEEAGIKYARALIITFSDEFENVYVILTAKQLNPSIFVVSRTTNERAEVKLRKVGADHVVMPEKIGGFYMATLVKNPNIVEFLNLLSNMGNTAIFFEEIPAEKIREEYRGKPIVSWEVRSATGANIIGLRLTDGHYVVNPDPDTVVTPGMHVVILGDTEQVSRFRERMLYD